MRIFFPNTIILTTLTNFASTRIICHNSNISPTDRKTDRQRWAHSSTEVYAESIIMHTSEISLFRFRFHFELRLWRCCCCYLLIRWQQHDKWKRNERLLSHNQKEIHSHAQRQMKWRIVQHSILVFVLLLSSCAQAVVARLIAATRRRWFTAMIAAKHISLSRALHFSTFLSIDSSFIFRAVHPCGSHSFSFFRFVFIVALLSLSLYVLFFFSFLIHRSFLCVFFIHFVFLSFHRKRSNNALIDCQVMPRAISYHMNVCKHQCVNCDQFHFLFDHIIDLARCFSLCVFVCLHFVFTLLHLATANAVMLDQLKSIPRVFCLLCTVYAVHVCPQRTHTERKMVQTWSYIFYYYYRLIGIMPMLMSWLSVMNHSNCNQVFHVFNYKYRNSWNYHYYYYSWCQSDIESKTESEFKIFALLLFNLLCVCALAPSIFNEIYMRSFISIFHFWIFTSITCYKASASFDNPWVRIVCIYARQLLFCFCGATLRSVSQSTCSTLFACHLIKAAPADGFMTIYGGCIKIYLFLWIYLTIAITTNLFFKSLTDFIFVLLSPFV